MGFPHIIDFLLLMLIFFSGKWYQNKCNYFK